MNVVVCQGGPRFGLISSKRSPALTRPRSAPDIFEVAGVGRCGSPVRLGLASAPWCCRRPARLGHLIPARDRGIDFLGAHREEPEDVYLASHARV
jgi:hypothetical protein